MLILKVELLNYTPEPDKFVAAAAKLCYSPVGISQIMEQLDEEKVQAFLDKLRESGHDSPIEHVSFTFGVEGVSRALTHQLVRHRIASFSQQSQRYVKFKAVEVVVPPTVKANPETAAIFQEAIDQVSIAYQRLLEAGVPAEDARFLLPNACTSKIIVTMNARSLLHFFELRTCTRAQWEIRQLALKMRELVKEVAPMLFRRSGPTCETQGFCCEGKLGCGLAPTLQELVKAGKSSN